MATITFTQYGLVYNAWAFTIAIMFAATIFLLGLVSGSARILYRRDDYRYCDLNRRLPLLLNLQQLEISVYCRRRSHSALQYCFQ